MSKLETTWIEVHACRITSSAGMRPVANVGYARLRYELRPEAIVKIGADWDPSADELDTEQRRSAAWR